MPLHEKLGKKPVQRDDWMLAVVVAAALLILGLFVAWPVPAQSQPACMSREALVDLLARRYGEHEVGWGVYAYGKNLVQRFESPNGSWTLVITEAGSVPCIVAGGPRWHSVSPSPAGRGEKS